MPLPELRIGMLAGEASGDILGSRLIAALRGRCGRLQVEGIGGPLMQAQGLESLYPMERLSVMGLVEPLKRLPELLVMRRDLRRYFLRRPPDLFLGIDAPDFNLALERGLRRAGIPTAHMVSPTVWAWRRGRMRGIRRSVDLMLCLFPFETAIYREHGVSARYVGHPLADELPLQPDRDAARAALGLAPQGRLLALLPGSRGSEVALLAPSFLEAASTLARRLPDLQIAVAAASAARASELRGYLARCPELPVTLLLGRSQQLMAASDAVLLASGTATLEAALCKRPMVVAYRMAPLSWMLVSRLVHTPFAALPNILAREPLVPELLQEAATPGALVDAVLPLLESAAAAREQVQGFEAIHRELRRDAAAQSAAALLDLLGQRAHG